MLFFFTGIFFLSLVGLFVFLAAEIRRVRSAVPESFEPRGVSVHIGDIVHDLVPVEQVRESLLSFRRTTRLWIVHFAGTVAGKVRDTLLSLARAIEGREVMRKREAVSFFLKRISEHKKFLKEQDEARTP